MTEGVRPLVAVSLRVFGAAATDRVEDDEDPAADVRVHCSSHREL
jgi:hypothetical protein